jgi:hypothetical protein
MAQSKLIPTMRLVFKNNVKRMDYGIADELKSPEIRGAILTST